MLNRRKLLFGLTLSYLITLPDPGSYEVKSITALVTKKEWKHLRERASALFFFSVLFYKSYLVDPASSHMLVSKIKPCMSKYKQLCTVKLRMAH